MVVELQTSNPSNYFNVTAPGASAATFNSSIEGNRFDGVLPSGGDWTIRVYLMRNAARRRETANYALSMEVGESTAQPAPDFADGNAGGPDFWKITSVSSRLNMRSGPSTSTGVVDSLRDELLNEEWFDSLDDARRKLALWRYDYNNVRPHSSLENQTPAEARRALEQFEGSAHDALAQTDGEEYEIQTR